MSLPEGGIYYTKDNSLRKMNVSYIYNKVRCHISDIRKSSFMLGWVLLLFLFSCSDSEFEYSNNRCYFVFDNAQHNDPTLTSALISSSPGTFCRIFIKGNKKYGFESNRGLKSETAMNSEDVMRTCILGVWDESGIIVGYGNLSFELYAYDAQCSNCYSESNMPRYTLSMSDIGHATCKTCKRVYDLNNGGIVIAQGKGNDKKLIRYRVSYTDTGTRRVLTVNN